MRNTRKLVAAAAAGLFAVAGCSGGERQNDVAAQADENVVDKAAESCADVG